MTATRCAGSGLFLETSAQIARLLEGKSSRDSIASLCARFERVGTSAFVEAEFNAIIVGFMNAIAMALSRLPNPDRARKFEHIWNEIVGLLPAYYPGKSLTTRFTLAVGRRLQRMPVSPRYIENTLRAQIRLLRGRFGIVGKRSIRTPRTFFDRTSCCLWQSKSMTHCQRSELVDGCRLHGNCWRERHAYEKAIRCLAEAPVEEKTVLSKRLPQLVAATDAFEYLKIITHHPNAFGDALIFSEVPEHWSLLTKDYAFFRLQKHLRRPVEVLKVRLPRKMVNRRCQVRIGTNPSVVVDAIVENASLRDLGVWSQQSIGTKRSAVAVHYDGRWCLGAIARVEVDPQDGSHRYGIRVTGYEQG